MRKEHTPSTVAPPFSRYSHGVEVDAARWLLISGQVGVDREGRLAEGAAAQMDQAWRNILAILDDAGMDAGNLVKITAYLTRRDDLKRSEEHTSELQSLMRISSAVLCLKKKKKK